MAKVLALDLMANRLLAVEVQGNGSSAVMAGRWQGELPTDFTLDQAETLGAWLREELKKAGLTTTSAVATVGRDRATLKMLTVPDAPLGELPAIVQFAVGSSAETTVIDFQPMPPREGQRDVTAVTLPATVVETWQAIARVAGLSLRRIGFRPYATKALWSQAGHEAACPMLVSAAGPLLEVSAWEGSQLLLARSTRVGDDEGRDARVAMEAKRTIAVFHSQFPHLQIDAVGLQARDAGSLKAVVKSAIDLPVHDITPAAANDDAAAATAFGLGLVELSNTEQPIDFQKPKKAETGHDRRKLMLVLGAVLAFLIPASGFSYYKTQQWRRDRQIEVYTSELNRLNSELAKYQPVLQRHRAIKEWTSGNTHWLDELYDLALTFPDTSEAYLTRLDLSVGEGAKAGNIDMEGRALTQEVITEAQTLWANDVMHHYALFPRGIDPTSDPAGFNWRFELELAIAPLTPQRYAERSLSGRDRFAMNVPPGMVREPTKLEVARTPSRVTGPGTPTATATSTPPATAPMVSSPPPSGSPPSAGPSSSTPSPPPGGSPPAAEETDPVAKLVRELKAMSYEQREQRIKAAPSFLQKRIRAQLEASK